MMKKEKTIKIPFVFELFFSNSYGHGEKSLERISLFLMYTAMLLLASMSWSLLCLYLGMNDKSLIPLAYIVLTLMNLAAFQTRLAGEWNFSFQVLISVSMPFIFQIILGGVFNAGMVMIWSSVALMTGIIFLPAKTRKFFLILFIIECCLVGVNEYLMVDRFGLYMAQVVLILINIAGATIVLFYVAERFILDQMSFKHKAYVHAEKINTLEKEKEQELLEIKDFKRRVLPSSMQFTSSFTDHFVSRMVKGTVGSAFYWLGNYYGNDILDIIDAKWKGTYGTMMSLECRNELNEAVYQRGEHEPARILNALSELLLKCCGSPKADDTPLGIMVLTYDCTSNELAAAGQGMEVFLKDGSRCGRLADLTTRGASCDATYYVKNSVLNSITLGEISHVVVYSHDYLNMLRAEKGPSRIYSIIEAWAKSNEDPKMHDLQQKLELEAGEAVKSSEKESDLISIGIRLSMWD